ncbi:MAG: MerR family transcriptional regulator [Proteobacteria bacterium]|nr:MerR family transcriptional regulator [Pseudomonadota bacterium]MDP4618676.1 MerR family transcriptional regulator [Burkholderiaceae bacterium]MDA0876228.1 MerR family transcriptional regulator [Pseudomonadota bacterium]MDA1187424.1 MerR family transcriptional regulator [Pseudomonadota bacterium]MDP4677198.1 MerR family transcriptional regulator [Burkholderiaceae bacterium]
MDQPIKAPIHLSIAAVERDTGLSKDTLRVWERRYGFPNPERDHFGERIYSIDQVDRLRAIRRLMDTGYRPGKIIGLSLEDLQALAESVSQPAPIASEDQAADLDQFMNFLKSHEIEDLRRQLSQRVLRLGLARFVTELVAPLTEKVGDTWARGQLEIYEEHLFTESMQVVLRNAISTIPQPGNRPRVLLTTFPSEPHGMGLLMVEALLALEGCRCFSLGVQTPVWDIVLASQAQDIDLVVLSFSPVMNPTLVVDGLTELRAKLPKSVEIWAGGRCPVLSRRAPDGIRVVTEFAELTKSVIDWRHRHSL